jgi:uncharacterized protein
MPESLDFLVMAKPGGPRCDLRCGYCYYVGNETALLGPAVGRVAGAPGAAGPTAGAGSAVACAPDGRRPKPPGRMSEELLELYIGQRFEAARGPEAGASRASAVHFEWHGGEPTLLGLDYYKRIARIERRLAPLGIAVTNGLQTNGLALNGAWAEFLSEEGWSVGLSLDGPAEVHDRCRRTAEGGPTHARVMRSYEALAARGVMTNLLCVLARSGAGQPDEVYGFFRGIGARYLQFLPLVTPSRGAAPHPEAASPEAVGAFLCRAFDLWIASDVGAVVVQNFDEALRPIYGSPHALCVHRERCGDVLVLERDGSVYACDHFVDEAHRLGSIRERSLADLASDPSAVAFGEAKRSTLPAPCRACEHLASCNGGCPKDRIAPSPDGVGRINYLCPAYLSFFAHARPELERLAAHMRAGQPLREFRAAPCSDERPAPHR